MKSHFGPEQWNTFAKRIRESKKELIERMELTNFCMDVFAQDNPKFNKETFVQRALPDWIERMNK